MKLTYTNVNGYLIPNLAYKSGEQMEQLGKYGFLRRDYLKNHKNSLYQVMLLEDTIGEHLLEVDKAAREQEEVIQKQLEEKETLPDKEDQMAWVRAVNQHRAIAEEIILKELILSGQHLKNWNITGMWSEIRLGMNRMNRAKVHIAAGLSLTWVATQKEDFQKYLLQNECVDFTFRNKEYHVEFAGEYDKSRVTIVRDICATAKGYEAMTVRKIQRNGRRLV